MSNGRVTLVGANGTSTTITVGRPGPHSVTDAVTISAGGGGGGVTSATVYYTGSAGTVPTSQFLMRTGSTYPLIAKDQSGNVLDGTVGSWSSSDPTNAPINSSTGVVSPSGVTGATFTYTHTASGVTATAKASVFPPTTAIKKETVPYANDAAFRANIANTVTTGYHTPSPTGSGASLYTDGLNEGAASVDTTRPFMANPTLLMSFNSTVGQPILRASLGTTLRRVVAMVVKRYDPGFNTYGDRPGDTTGTAASYKDFFLDNSGQSGRTSIEYTNAIEAHGECNTLDGGGSIVAGAVEQNLGNVSDEWSSGDWYIDIVEYNAWDSVKVQWARYKRIKIGENPLTTNRFNVQHIRAGACNGVNPMHMNYVSALGENYNRPLTGIQLYKSIGYWEVVDGVTYGDPFGSIGDTSTPTLTGISGGTVAHGSTANTIVLTGTNFTEGCYPIFSDPQITAHWVDSSGISNVTINSSTQMTVVVDVGSTATIGAGTVYIRNDVSQQSSGTQTVTVT